MIDKKIIKNIAYIGLTNVANILIPLLILPFITRALGPAQFGQYAWAISSGTLLSVICDFGFNWSAAREVAVHKADPARVAKIITEAYAIRMSLVGLCSAAIFAVWCWLPHEAGVGVVLPFVPFIAFLNLLTPAWLFQGLEQFRVIAISSTLGRLCGVIAIFILVKGPEDTNLAITLSAVGALLPAIVSFLFINRHFGSVLSVPAIDAIFRRIKEAWRIFAADFVIQIYTVAQTFIVGLFGGPVAAAQFNIADRCLGAGKGFLAAIIQAAMPRVANLASSNPAAGLRLIRQVMVLTGGVGIMGGLIMMLGADQLVLLAFGPDFLESARVLRILAPVPLLVGIGTCFSSLYMFNYGENGLWAMMLKTAAFINFGIMLILHFLGTEMHIAAAIAILSAESFVFLISGYRFFLAHRKLR
ncbi:oligosaccharide flippase family protein [Niveispirillum irakense]|uniref:oligosaccharide flippase family protein n=1 Tax=Niveispirillum irakense TaxID=34011 RepID=UPI000424D25D|nr:oligosaccharide flippase family protein [Niveispirillum irakense]